MTKFLPRRGRLFWALGLILCVFALVGLLQTPSVSQYIAVAPEDPPVSADAAEDVTAIESGLLTLVKAWEKQRDALNETTGASAMYAIRFGDTLSSASKSGTATVLAVDEGYFSVTPKYLVSGRLISQAEHSAGSRVIVLDEQLAFLLFPTVDAIDSTVSVCGAAYRVIGVTRHSRAAGDLDAYAAYLPLRAVAKDGVQMQYIALSAWRESAAASRALKQAGMEIIGQNGEFFDFDKEVLRATMLMRVIGIIFSLSLFKRLLGYLNGTFSEQLRIYQTNLKTMYVGAFLPKTILRGVMLLIAYAALALMGVIILKMILTPLYVFPEWVPDVIVEWSSVKARVMELLREFNRPVKLQTPEIATVRVYAYLLRAGVITLLVALIYTLMRDPKRKGRKNGGSARER